MGEEFATLGRVGTDRQEGHCPVCGNEYDDTTELTERRRNGDVENVPGHAFDHDGGELHIEWADGEIVRG